MAGFFFDPAPFHTLIIRNYNFFKLLYFYKIYKPYQVLSQFTSEAGKSNLHDWFDVPKDVYPLGRLDYDSEGLLLLTNHKELNHRLLNPAFAHEREYWAQVEGKIDEEAIGQLQNGVSISADGKNYVTRAAVATAIAPPAVAERNPPIRYRKEIPDSWVSLVLKEGKNRQVRKMTAAVGFPTLRLIRYRIGLITIDGMQPGEMVEMKQSAMEAQLFGINK